ncbi:MAG: hypothetical protein ACK5JJ_11845 [Cyanobacteriota bacterium]
MVPASQKDPVRGGARPTSSSGYGPPFVKLGNLVRYTFEDVELWLARQLEISRG